MRDVDRTIRTLIAPARMGVRLAIDDFGTSSSLNYRQFPVNALKIDCSFVSDIGSDGAENKIARNHRRHGLALGLEAVAEGVESEAQRAFLQMHGCHQLQGFLIARLAPAREIERFLSRRPGIARLGGTRRSAASKFLRSPPCGGPASPRARRPSP